MNAQTTLKTFALVTLAGFALALGAGCSAAPDGQGEETGSQSEKLMPVGNGGNGNTCTRAGVLSSSDPFEGCLIHAGCTGTVEQVMSTDNNEWLEIRCDHTTAVLACVKQYASTYPYDSSVASASGCSGSAAQVVDWDPICPGGCTGIKH